MYICTDLHKRTLSLSQKGKNETRFNFALAKKGRMKSNN